MNRDNFKYITLIINLSTSPMSTELANALKRYRNSIYIFIYIIYCFYIDIDIPFKAERDGRTKETEAEWK